MIPPCTPHFGGLWESAIKRMKHHLRRTVGNQILSQGELSTYVTEIEAILNSRPLTPLSTSPNDLESLMPAHFLIGEPLKTLPTYKNEKALNLTKIQTRQESNYECLRRQKFYLS